MSDEISTPPAVAAPEPVDPVVSLKEKRELAQTTLTELLRLMDVPAALDVKDAGDGGISVALTLEAELAGVQTGRRSHFVDALQFLLNKLVNKPGTPRHWVTLGVGGHAEPRGPKAQREPAPPAPPRAAAAPAPASSKVGPARAAAAPQRPAPASSSRAPAAPAERDERKLEVPEDAALRAEAAKLAVKSAQLGRFYALVGMKPEERAQVLKGAEAVPGVKLSAEGEGRNRRLVFTPEKPSPMPKRLLPVDDDEDLG